ncbi:amidase [Pigmentiphaga soli]|uniref:Amidase n=1 Tax=Pigmentiphaga soli TaxID=1007095 RepID=A0ABP8GSI9_9BURK
MTNPAAPLASPKSACLPQLYELSRALREGALSCVDLAAACLARIRDDDGRLGAFVEVYADGALAAAEQADRLLRAGTWLGPLHGMPVAVKDAIEVEGRPTTFGLSARSGRRASRSAAVVERLQAAGAIILGKTHLVQFALGAWGANEQMGTPRNPWDERTHRVPGGSSSGSAVAVAAGMAPLALGTDTGGSVRVPAAFCGITGFKPEACGIDRRGVLPLSRTLDSVGLFARSAIDAAAAYDAVRADAGRALPQLAQARDLQGVRLGRLGEADLQGVAGPVREAYEAALEAMRRDGARIVAAAWPGGFAEAADVTSTIMLAEGAAEHGRLAADAGQPIDEPVRRRLLAGARIPATAYIDALRARERWQATYRAAAAAAFDAVVTPATPATAVALDGADHLDPPIRFTRMLNLLDVCGIALPCGFDDQGLPIGIQIAAGSGGADLLLAIAHRYQALTDWHLRLPPDGAAPASPYPSPGATGRPWTPFP